MVLYVMLFFNVGLNTRDMFINKAINVRHNVYCSTWNMIKCVKTTVHVKPN